MNLRVECLRISRRGPTGDGRGCRFKFELLLGIGTRNLKPWPSWCPQAGAASSNISGCRAAIMIMIMMPVTVGCHTDVTRPEVLRLGLMVTDLTDRDMIMKSTSRLGSRCEHACCGTGSAAPARLGAWRLRVNLLPWRCLTIGIHSQACSQSPWILISWCTLVTC